MDKRKWMKHLKWRSEGALPGIEGRWETMDAIYARAEMDYIESLEASLEDAALALASLCDATEYPLLRSRIDRLVMAASGKGGRDG